MSDYGVPTIPYTRWTRLMSHFDAKLPTKGFGAYISIIIATSKDTGMLDQIKLPIYSFNGTVVTKRPADHPGGYLSPIIVAFSIALLISAFSSSLISSRSAPMFSS